MFRLYRKSRENFDGIGDIIFFLYIFMLINIISLLLEFVSVQKLLKLINPYFKSQNFSDEKISKLVKYTDFWLNRSVLYFDKNCLKRSIVLFYMLRKMGKTVDFNIGIKPSDDQNNMIIEQISRIDGHAWLTLGGEIYLEKRPEFTKHYKIIYSYP